MKYHNEMPLDDNQHALLTLVTLDALKHAGPRGKPSTAKARAMAPSDVVGMSVKEVEEAAVTRESAFRHLTPMTASERCRSFGHSAP